jgi:hypothetical protein
MLIVACMNYRRLPDPPAHLTAIARRGLMVMIVVAVLVHKVDSSNMDGRSAASGGYALCPPSE